MALPLRIRAERHASKKFGEKQTFILPSKEENEVCLIIHDSGLVAVVVSTQDSLSTQQHLCSLLGINDSSSSLSSLPKYTLVIEDSSDGAPSSNASDNNRRNSNGSRWIETSTGADASGVSKDTMVGAAVCSHDSSRIIVEAIERYYGRQVLEPSIRGFLSILEKQFPSNNLYLFELLQNAVDDGASVVKFKATDRGIVFMHDGREFTSMDVLGLASVGLSTKSSDKRSVGFMGIGFKAVYKRFAKVIVYDSKWKFCFEEPSEKSAIKPAHAWVMEPRWLKAPVSALSSTGGHGDDETNWCHFELQQPRVPIKTVHEDLRRIPYSIPPLLGKQALKNFALENNTSKSSWTLEWNRRKFITHIANDDINNSSRDQACNGGKIGGDDVGFQNVIVSEYAEGSSQLIDEKYWQFINLSFIPSTSAQAAYLTHTKKAWSSSGDSKRREETSFFFQVDKQGVVVPNQTGFVHSILPTKVKLPTSVSWQGSWLLSVDRQEVIFDQEWNKCIASKAGPLLLGLLRWIATRSLTENALYSSYSMLPNIIKESSSYHVMLLGVKTDVTNLLLHVKREDLVPCLPNTTTNDAIPGKSSGHVCYGKATEVCWLPPPFLNRLPPLLLSSWFGMKVFTSSALKELAWSPLFTSSLIPVTQSLLYKRKNSFKIDTSLLKPSKSVLETAVSLLCAVSECLSSSPPSEKNKDGKEKSENPDEATDTLLQPDFASWPIFLSDDESNTLYTVNEIVIPSTDFIELPLDIRNLLRSSMINVESVNMEDHSKDSDGHRDRDRERYRGDRDRDRKYSHSTSSSKSTRIHCLHPELEMMLLYAVSQPTHHGNKSGHRDQRSSHHSISSSSTLSSSMQSSISRQDQQHLSRIYSSISNLAPNTIISVEQCASALFKKWTSASATGCDESVVKGCMILFSYALQSRDASLIPSLLCKRPNFPDKLFLSPASDVYLSEEYTGSCGAAIESINAKMGTFQVIASNYHPNYKHNATNASTSDNRKQTSNRREIMAVEQLLIAAGAQSTIKVEATARIAKTEDFSRTSSGTAPKLRSTNTSSFFDLPYNLGTINRKHHYVLDIRLTREWEKIIDACRSDVALAESVSTIIANALCNTDNATIATADSSPALALVLKGQAAVDRDTPMPIQRDAVVISNSQPIPAIQRLIFLPPGQPGASTEKLQCATWIQFLKSRPWLPASVSDINASNGILSAMKPSEVRLDSKSDVDQSIPLVSLPSSTLSLLQSMPNEVKTEFAFGTVKPRPPIERLVQIIKSSASADSRKVEDLRNLQEMCDMGLYLELISIWKAISSAHKDGTLSREDRNNILSAFSKYPDALVFPHPHTARCVYSLQRCVRMQPNSLESTKALCAIEYLLDLNETEYHSLLPSSMLTSSASQSILDLFLNSVSKFSTEIRSTFHLRVAFTTCLTSFVMHEYMRLGRRTSGNVRSIVDIREEDYSAISSKFRQKLPELKILCGHGPGPKGFTPQWRSLYNTSGSTEKDTILPVVIDDQLGNGVIGSGFAKSSMLRLSHGYQPIMTLSPFTMKEHNSFQDLNEQNHVLLKMLDIPRISDNKMFSLRTKNSGSPQFLESETDRLHACVLLLHLLSNKNSIGSVSSINTGERMKRVKAIKVVRYNSIELHFKTPRMEAAEVTNKHSVWGPPKLITEEEKTRYSGSLLLAGDLIDYVADLEEMLVLRLNESYLNLNTKDARRALKLLSHIESNESFLKIFDRDFKSLLNFGDRIDTKTVQCDEEMDIDGDKEENKDDDDEIENIESSLCDILTKLRPKLNTAKSSRKRQHEEMGTNEIHVQGNETIGNLDDNDMSKAKEMKVVNDEACKKSAEEVAAIGRGSGRGISLAPAWMNNDTILLDKQQLDSRDNNAHTTNDTETKLEKEGKKSVSQGVKSDTPQESEVTDSWEKWEPPEAKMAGRGRGISLLPAWMTNQQSENATTDVKLENLPPLLDGNEEVQTHQNEESKELLQSSLDAGNLEGRGGGRGRGISLLPAWMTSGVSDAQLSGAAAIVSEEETMNMPPTELDQAELEDFLESCMTESAEHVKEKQEQLSKANKRKLEEMIKKEKLEKKLAMEAAEKERKEQEEKQKTIAKIITKGKSSFSNETTQIVKKLLTKLLSKGHILATDEINALVSSDILCDAICAHIDKSAVEKVRCRKEAEQVIDIVDKILLASNSGSMISTASIYGKASNNNNDDSRSAKKQKLKYGPG